MKHQDYEGKTRDSFEGYSYEEDYSDEEEDEGKVGGGGGLGLKMKKGQKMSQKQLQMLEMAAEEKKTSTNPLCKENNMFRLSNNKNAKYVLKFKFSHQTSETPAELQKFVDVRENKIELQEPPDHCTEKMWPCS